MKQFRIKASESLQNSLAGAIYKDKKWENGDKKSSWKGPNYKKSSQQLPLCVIVTTDLLFRMPKLQEIFTTAAIVFHRYERLAVLQNVLAIIVLWARKDVEKRFEETVHVYQ